MTDDDPKMWLLLGCVFAGLAAGFLAWMIFSASQESAVYNRLTGAHTTTWDALWVELRVQQPAN